MSHRTAACLLSALATLVEVSALADEPVRVYTNADIARLEPIPTQSAPIVQGPELGWEFVQQFIDREHARLDAERARDIERLRAEAELQEAKRQRYSMAYAPYVGAYGYGYGSPWWDPGQPDGGPKPGPRRLRRIEPNPMLRLHYLHFPTGAGRIEPLHAR